MKVHDTSSPLIPIFLELVLTARLVHHKDIISLAIWLITCTKLAFLITVDHNTLSNMKSNIRLLKYMILGVH